MSDRSVERSESARVRAGDLERAYEATRRDKDELARRAGELEQANQELDRRARELERAYEATRRDKDELARRAGELEQANQELDRRAGEWQRWAREVNDTIVQTLIAAETTADLGRIDESRQLLHAATQAVRDRVTHLLAEGGPLLPGSLVRQQPAEHSRPPR